MKMRIGLPINSTKTHTASCYVVGHCEGHLKNTLASVNGSITRIKGSSDDNFVYAGNGDADGLNVNEKPPSNSNRNGGSSLS